jgi:hypothetical protein
MRLAVLTLALALSAFSADLTGKWKGSMPGRDGNAREISFTFKADGAKLTGSMMGPMGNEVAISDGKVEGQDVSFKVVLEFNGNAMSLNYTGKLDGDDLRLKMQREGAPRAMEMSLKKAGS